jgi:hypothetical protein
MLCDVIRPRDDENTVWTNSQDYRADEILCAIQTAIFHKTTGFTSEITTLFRIPPQLFQLLNLE